MTGDIYYHLTIQLDHAKRDSRLTAYGGVVLQRLEGFEFLKVCMVTQVKFAYILRIKSTYPVPVLYCFCCLLAPQADLTRFW